MIRKDRTSDNGGGLIVYINESIPHKPVEKYKFPDNFEVIPFEINLRKRKWLILATYCQPTNQSKNAFCEVLNDALAFFYKLYENVIIIGDLNMTVSDPKLEQIMISFSLSNLIKEPTCFKSTTNPSSIDHILTNQKSLFMKSTAIETGISDFHKCVLTILRSKFIKGSPKVISYRKLHDNLSTETIANALENVLESNQIDTYDEFQNTLISIVDKFAPIKKKIVRYNDSPFMTKKLRKAIMHRSRLKNRYLKHPSPLNKLLFKQQRNRCVNLLKSTKKQYYQSLNTKTVNDNRSFWKSIKPSLTKEASNTKITLIEKVTDQNGNEKESIISDDNELANTFNKYFATITKSLNIPSVTPLHGSNPDILIDEIITKYCDHISILKIKENYHHDECFEFSHITEEELANQIKKLDSNKSSPSNDIPPKIVKSCANLIVTPLTKIFNGEVIDCGKFPEQLKSAEVIPIYKKDSKTSKKNYRPISILPVISKIYERIICDQLDVFMSPLLSPYLCGFRKGFNTQHALLRMVESWKRGLDKGKVVGAFLWISLKLLTRLVMIFSLQSLKLMVSPDMF